MRSKEIEQPPNGHGTRAPVKKRKKYRLRDKVVDSYKEHEAMAAGHRAGGYDVGNDPRID